MLHQPCRYVINCDTIILLTQAETTGKKERKKIHILTGYWSFHHFYPIKHLQHLVLCCSDLMKMLLILHKHKMLHSRHTTGLKEHDGLSIKLMLAVSCCHRRFNTFLNISGRTVCSCWLPWLFLQMCTFWWVWVSEMIFSFFWKQKSVWSCADDIHGNLGIAVRSIWCRTRDVKKVNNEEPQLCLLCGVRAPQRTGPHCWGSDETFVQIQAEMELLSILTSVKQHNLISRKEKKELGLDSSSVSFDLERTRRAKGPSRRLENKQVEHQLRSIRGKEPHLNFFFFFLHFWIINRDQVQERVTVRRSILLVCYGEVITSADMMAVEAGRRQRGLNRWANNNPLMSSHSGHFQIN